MELLLNLVWLVLSLSLAALWIRGSRRAVASSGQVDWRVQLLALAMLIVILLPVISMTDDVQAMSAAEIEHVTRRADLLPNSDQPADIPALLNTTLLSYEQLSDVQIYARIEPVIESLRPQTRSIRQIANRPPPLAV
ncbi:hypothetical protein [Alloacidobacterium sp.]|uniref:hypothetical protein n=1 Tax=Alloacidobacterium sp. TaxID=2951999 RepID=UPI002D6E280C|nr:hypothetical protein [Alloacidobacterium sp.]HYK38334.1 hypothetical protein [Alloacidobacterium sp.]